MRLKDFFLGSVRQNFDSAKTSQSIGKSGLQLSRLSLERFLIESISSVWASILIYFEVRS